MKLGESGDAVNAISYSIQEGYSTPSWPYDKAVKVLEAIDNSIIDVINFGAREHRTAEFSLNYMTKADQATLKTYLDLNLGKKIKVTIENAGERVFGEIYTAGSYYAYLISAKPLGESGFSPTRGLFGYGLVLDFAGTLSTSVPNAADQSQYDFLIEIDCVRVTAGCQVANVAALNAITNKPGGSRGLALDTRKVYFYRNVPLVQGGVTTAAGWDYQYTLPANDAAQGLLNGVFRLSAFADISSSSTGIGGFDYKSGWIVERSIRFPRYSVDARQGPAVEHPEAFTFAIDNSAKRWKYPLDYNLAFYGALCSIYVYDRLNAQKVLMRTGFNNRNNFDYTVLEFEVEPGIFFQNRSFPPTLSSKTNFPNADEKMLGKPLLTTYGRWDKGKIQTQSFDMNPIKFPNKQKILNVYNSNSGSKYLYVKIDPAQFTKILGYPTGLDFSNYPQTTYQFLYVSIISQNNQGDLKKLKKIVALANDSGYTRLTLDQWFKDVVDTTALVIIYFSNVQMIIDPNSVIGMNASNYLLPGVDGDYKPLELFSKIDNKIIPVPARPFALIQDGKKNQLTVDSNYISLDSAGSLTVTDYAKCEIVASPGLHAIIDKRHANGYDYFDFGFTPTGIESNEIPVTPIARINRWVDKAGSVVDTVGQVSSFFSGSNTSRPSYVGQGKVIAIPSKTFTTIIWTPFFGATGYRITRNWASNDARYIAGSGTAGTSFDFGNGAGLALGDGTVVTAASGTVEITGGSIYLLNDFSVDQTGRTKYFYKVEPVVNGQTQPQINSDWVVNRPVVAGNSGLFGLGLNTSVILCWSMPDTQASYSVTKDAAVLSGMPVVSAVKNWHLVTGLSNDQEYKFKVAVNCLAIGTIGDTWMALANTTDRLATHQLLKNGAPYSTLPYYTAFDVANSDQEDYTNLRYAKATGTITRKNSGNADGLDFPAAGVVFSWLWKIDKDALGDLTSASDVRILSDFVIRSWVGNNTPVPFIIQLRGLKADKTVAFTIPYNNLTAKAPVESGSYGAFAKFLNLPKPKGGDDANYETDVNTPNANGIYTGKDLWKLPDWLFQDNAYEWSQIEYFMFSITNSAPIAYADIAPRAINTSGYHLGLGGPALSPGADWGQVRDHKPDLYIEGIRKLDGGLKEPLFARIDGGVIDDSIGSITGTPYKIIEKSRHVVDHVLNATIGIKPIRLGNEMKNRDSWIWRWQVDSSKPLTEILDVIARNSWGIFTLTPDDKLYLRSLDIDNVNTQPVFNFTDANIIRDSLGKPEMRRRSEIYQKFKLKYNVDPTQDAATESMIIGWDLAAGKAIESGFADHLADETKGIYDEGDAKNLSDTCRLSIQLNAAGLGLNEYGTSLNDEKVFEMFYRPTRNYNESLSPERIERTLPNLSTLWAGSSIPPKAAMRELAKMVVNFFAYDSWYIPLSCSMKNVIYNSSVTGVKDEAGTPDNRLKLGDLVTITSDFHTNGQTVRGFIFDMDMGSIYDGLVTLHIFCPRPPGQFGPFVDQVWDAGGIGARNEADYLFKGNLYGLLSEDGTYPDAGGTGSRNETQFRFPDGTYADPFGLGSGKA